MLHELQTLFVDAVVASNGNPSLLMKARGWWRRLPCGILLNEPRSSSWLILRLRNAKDRGDGLARESASTT
jgi:hypothetical protein